MLEGYAEAGVTEIVALAGASVGSLYHHFSGKADLYLALFEELSNEHDIRTRKAVRECRDSGVTDPMRLLLAGARGYLDVCIEQRDLASMFARGDGPPGFEVLWRKRLSDWVQQEHRVLRAQRRAAGRGGGDRDDRRDDAGRRRDLAARGTPPEPGSWPMACLKCCPDCASRQPRSTGLALVAFSLTLRCVQKGAPGDCCARPGWSWSWSASAVASRALAPSSHSSQIAASASPRSQS